MKSSSIKTPICEFVHWTSEYLHMPIGHVTRAVDIYLGKRFTKYLNQKDMYILRDMFLKYMNVDVVTTDDMTYYIHYVDRMMQTPHSRGSGKYYDGIMYATGIL